MSSNPLDLEIVFATHRIDWRTSIDELSASFVRSYIDRRDAFSEDIKHLVASKDHDLLMRTNMRLPKVIFGEHCDLQSPWLLSRVTDFLFRPNEHLENAINDMFIDLKMIEPPNVDIATRDTPIGVKLPQYISIHYRTGDIAWDPHRHNSTLSSFLQCAMKAERELGLPASIPWILHTDSLRTVPPEYYTSVVGIQNEQRSVLLNKDIVSSELDDDGAIDNERTVEAHDFSVPVLPPAKIRIPGSGGRVHIDRSDFDDAVEGYIGAYAEWYAISKASAVILSRSFFGETAAEIGRVKHSYFVTGCVRVDLSSS